MWPDHRSCCRRVEAAGVLVLPIAGPPPYKSGTAYHSAIHGTQLILGSSMWGGVSTGRTHTRHHHCVRSLHSRVAPPTPPPFRPITKREPGGGRPPPSTRAALILLPYLAVCMRRQSPAATPRARHASLKTDAPPALAPLLHQLPSRAGDFPPPPLLVAD